MHHAPTIFQSFLTRGFQSPAVTLQCAVRHLCRNASTQRRYVNQRELATARERTPTISASRLQLQRPWLNALGPAIWSRNYAAKRGKYGNMTEGDYKNNTGKIEQVSLQSIQQIFGKDVDQKHGNDIMSKLQRRRVTGTLDHETQDPSVAPGLLEPALAWLREKYPMDEDKAIVERIEREEGEKEEQFIAESERNKNWYPQQRAKTEGLYGKPMVDEFAKKWNARQEEKRKAREERKRQYAELKANYEAKRIADSRHSPKAEITDSRDSPKAEITAASDKAVYTGKKETAEWIKRYEEKARLSDLLEPPKMTLLQRLGPSYAMFILILAFSAFFATNYMTPPANMRLFPDWPVSLVTLLSITGINLAVWACWKIPQLWRIMNGNFMGIVGLPRARTLLLSSFSHQSLSHLFGNMVGLWLIGLPLHSEVGRGEFLSIYSVGAVCGGILTLTHYARKGPLETAYLGASAAVCGIWAAWSWLPARTDEEGDGFKQFAKWFGRPDLDSYTTWITRLLLIGLIVFEFRLKKEGMVVGNKIDFWGHIGGYGGGIASAEFLLWWSRRQKYLKEHPELNFKKHAPTKPHFVTMSK